MTDQLPPARTCSVEGCNKPPHGRGFCSNHWYRWQKHGSPTAGRPFGTIQCTVRGCNKPHLAKGYCGAHYKRWQNHGSPTGGRIAFKGTPAAFIEKALKHQTDDCLLWPYGQSHGYGSLNFNGIRRDAYSLVCELAHGSKPAPACEAAHSCNVRLCVNPKHLRWDTPAGNAKDSAGEVHWNAKLTAKQVQKIRSEKHLSSTIMARELGVSYDTIYQVRNYIIWRHEP